MTAATDRKGRVALISGASRGIGAAIAERLAGEGWQVSLGMREPKAPAWDTAGAAHLHAYTVGDPDAERQWVEAALARFGRIDAIVANAGIMVPKSVIEIDEADFDAMLEINVKAPRRLAQAAWEALVRCGRGRAIILGSLSGKRIKSASASSYSVTKFAAVALAHALRHTGFDLGIRATAVCPGFVATDMARSLVNAPDAEMTSPADLARIVSMLLDLPNEASVAEFCVNCRLDESY